MKYLRYFLFPFSVLYGSMMSVRNYLYDLGILKSKSYPIPVICVGNLNTGGTGKSPMIELLIKSLRQNYNLATLSRGYKRTTTGFLEVEVSHTTSEVGDEPLQFKTNFPEITVAVDEDRQRGISHLLKHHPHLDLILLDDAFQHRKVRPDLSILLTTYMDLYTKDMVLPTGNLREFSMGAKRAQIIVVTKCPAHLSLEAQFEIEKQLKPLSSQSLFFSTILYSEFVCGRTKSLELADFNDFTLVTGIANPKPLLKHLQDLNKNFEHINFPDHHEFSEDDIRSLETRGRILTTQKDFMRLQSKLKTEELYYIPIETKLLNNPEAFNHAITIKLF